MSRAFKHKNVLSQTQVRELYTFFHDMQVFLPICGYFRYIEAAWGKGWRGDLTCHGLGVRCRYAVVGSALQLGGGR